MVSCINPQNFFGEGQDIAWSSTGKTGWLNKKWTAFTRGRTYRLATFPPVSVNFNLWPWPSNLSIWRVYCENLVSYYLILNLFPEHTDKQATHNHKRWADLSTWTTKVVGEIESSKLVYFLGQRFDDWSVAFCVFTTTDFGLRMSVSKFFQTWLGSSYLVAGNLIT